MTDDRVRGRFIWHELRTPNPAGARDFYSTALGWKTEGAEPDSPYSTFVASSGPLGGCAAQAPTDVPRWIPFVTVADVDDSFRQAVDLGAGVVVAPTAIEEGGRYAVLTDPQGAAIGVYSAEDFGADRDPSPGEFSWHELATTDSRAALDFYGALFGWALLTEYDMGPMGAYLIFGHGEKQLGGIFNKDDAGMSGEPAWLSYVRVSDLSGTIEKVQSARGSLLTGPMEVPGGDWIAQLIDPHGAAFALHAVAADAKGEAANAARAKKESEKAEAARAEPAKAERATAKSASRLNAQSTVSTITDIWSPTATGGRTEEPTRAAKTTAKKKRSTTKAKAAKSKATKKKASKAKKAGGKTAKKKTAAKKPATKKAGSKTATKKAAKKAASKKAAKKKAAKKTAKKKSSKTSKKTTGGKTSTKKSGAKKAGKKTGAAKKSGKKAAAKKASKKASKKRSNKASPGAGKKSGKKSKAGSSESKKAGKKKTGKKARKKSGRR